MSLLFAGTATSQSTLDNVQLNTGNITAETTYGTATDPTTMPAGGQDADGNVIVAIPLVTSASGNTLGGQVVSGDLNVAPVTQTSTDAVSATTSVYTADDPSQTVDHSNGPTVSITTAATGNSGDADNASGALTGSFVQTTSGGPITATSDLIGPDSRALDVTQSTQAMGNSQGLAGTDTAINATVQQTSGTDVISNAGNGGAGGGFGFIGDQGVMSSTAVGNNVTSTGVGNSSATLNVVQQQATGTVVQGTQFSNFANSQDTSTSATATANNFNASNEQGTFDVTVSQTNGAYVRAQANENSYQYGGATVSAYGVGNSTFAGNAGPSISLTNSQFNGGGGVEAVADFTSGGGGYDASVAATAMGNAATGYACSACGGVMNVHNNQTNTADVSATSTVGVGAPSRSITATSTAVGNNATYYVTQPNH